MWNKRLVCFHWQAGQGTVRHVLCRSASALLFLFNSRVTWRGAVKTVTASPCPTHSRELQQRNAAQVVSVLVVRFLSLTGVVSWRLSPLSSRIGALSAPPLSLSLCPLTSLRVLRCSTAALGTRLSRPSERGAAKSSCLLPPAGAALSFPSFGLSS